MVLFLLALLTAAAIAYMVAGSSAAIAVASGMVLEGANLGVTERLGRRLMDPSRGQAGWFQLFYFVKYGLLIAAFAYLAVGAHLGVVPLAIGFTLALVLHIGVQLARVPNKASAREGNHAP